MFNDSLLISKTITVKHLLSSNKEYLDPLFFLSNSEIKQVAYAKGYNKTISLETNEKKILYFEPLDQEDYNLIFDILSKKIAKKKNSFFKFFVLKNLFLLLLVVLIFFIFLNVLKNEYFF